MQNRSITTVLSHAQVSRFYKYTFLAGDVNPTAALSQGFDMLFQQYSVPALAHFPYPERLPAALVEYTNFIATSDRVTSKRSRLRSKRINLELQGQIPRTEAHRNRILALRHDPIL